MECARHRYALILLLGGIVTCMQTGAVMAEPYPTKPLKFIVPAVAGTPPDVRARWLAERLFTRLGQRVVVENKPGAGGIIGAAAAARSAPDGYTLLMVTQGTLAFNPHLYANPGYNALKDFDPVTRVSVGTLLLAVNPELKVNTVGELINFAKSSPGQLTFGSAGIGTPPHMAGELFKRMAGIEVTVVPYKGGNMAQFDVMAGRVSYTIDGIGVLLPFIKAGKLRALAVSSAQRASVLPNIPTIAESGLTGFDYEAWSGVCVPSGTPRKIVARLNAALVKILRSPEATDWFSMQGVRPVDDSPEAFAAYIKAEHTKWGNIIRTTGMKSE